MEVVHPRCCGIDVHQASLAVCVVIKEKDQTEKHRLCCGTTTAELLRLADWLHGHQVTHVAMEATGVYWKPVWHILEGQFKLLLANPVQVQALRGRKTDLKDGERIADFMQHGLLAGSFVPPQPIQQLRDLTRSRTTLKQEQVRIGNRIRKVLEDANLKLSSVMSDVMGVSGQAMLRAMVRGESDPEVLAQLARKRLRGKIALLQEAATGSLNEHHRFLLEQWLAHWDELVERIAKFDQRIEEQMRPFAAALETWNSIPGIDRITAWTMIAELGPDMNQFPTVAHAASWAGLCPGAGGECGKTEKRSDAARQRLAPAGANASCLGGQHDKRIVLQSVLPPIGGPQRKEASHCRSRACVAVHWLHALVD